MTHLELETDKFGNAVVPAKTSILLDPLVKDLFVMSHGWNTDLTDARALYSAFFQQFAATLHTHAARGATSAHCASLGILWPSIRFQSASLDQIAGLAPPAQAARIAEAKALLPALDGDTANQRAFVDAVRSLLCNERDDEGAHCLFGMEGDELLAQLNANRAAADPEEGGAACFGLSGIGNAVRKLLNVTTYQLMKDRAGVIGRGGVTQALDQIQTAFPAVRIHLVGHSFGCRVITAAAAAVARPVASMTLLQAAFSHNSFSPDFDSTHRPGGFRSVVVEGKCAGPILITHTVNDLAVGLAYPLASRLGGENAGALGDAGDVYGGLGRNGARHTPESSDEYLLAEGAAYSFRRGGITNLNADHIIRAHGDVVKPETAWALIAGAGLIRGN